MKRIFIPVLLLGYLISYSQTERGRMTFGVSQFSLNYSKTNNQNSSTKVFATTISPSAGKFVVDNLLIGASLNTMFSTYKSTSLYKTNNSSYSLGPWIEYYFGSSERGKPYVGLRPSYGFGKYKFTDSNGTLTNEKVNFGNLNITGGYALFLNSSFMLRFEAGYNFSKNSFKFENSSTNTTKDNRFFFGVGILATFAKD